MAGKIRDHVEKYFVGKGYNCAESTFLAANDAWELGMPAEAAKMMGGFGGGMATKGVCGAVSGGAAALSCLLVRESGHNSPLLMAKVKKYKELVIERLESENCSVLGPKYQTPATSCLQTILLCVDILDEVKDMEIDAPEYMPRKVKTAFNLLENMLKDEHIIVDMDDNGIENAVKLPENLSELEKYKGINIILCGADAKKLGSVGEWLKTNGCEKVFIADAENLK
ncbi:MAG: C-GCAxxG-C-C family protein [Clostridia bacterium]|nr:C-GCAxxG-C-C family protein [Clostridia bacterium]MBR5265010.1 C-GCAxxG-C-C family protein [Clostridia bacterium]